MDHTPPVWWGEFHHPEQGAFLWLAQMDAGSHSAEMIAGIEQQDEGRIVRAKSVRIGYLPQEGGD